MYFVFTVCDCNFITFYTERFSERKTFTNYPVTVYQVYLNGETIGVIEDEEKLYNLINKEQKSLRNEFKVNKIYAPIGLETTKLVTYEGSVDSVETVYDKIKDVESLYFLL